MSSEADTRSSEVRVRVRSRTSATHETSCSIACSRRNWSLAVSAERAIEKPSEMLLMMLLMMLLIMSPTAVASNIVHDKWSYFPGMGRAVCPFIYQPCELPFRLRRQYGATTGMCCGCGASARHLVRAHYVSRDSDRLKRFVWRI